MAILCLALRKRASHVRYATATITGDRTRLGLNLILHPKRCCSGTSALFQAATSLRDSTLAASLLDEVPCRRGPLDQIQPCSVSDWAAVRGQAAMVSNWPKHPFEPEERLGLAEVLVSRAGEIADGHSVQHGFALCSFYRQVLLPSNTLFKTHSAGTAKCALVIFADTSVLPASTAQLVAFLLGGYAVTLAAPPGPALDAAMELTAGFPAELLQAEACAPLTAIPNVVHSLRVMGSHLRVLSGISAQRPLPLDTGGIEVMQLASSRCENLPYGTLDAAIPLALMRTDIAELVKLPRSRFELNDTAADLLSLLSTASAVDAPTAPGLPPPRWARSAFDRGIEEVHDLLDLLWAFREPSAVGDNGTLNTLAPASKHFIMTPDRTEVPEEIVKAAVVSALSPFREPITVHIVGVGARGIMRDPLKSFCRLVQSRERDLCWHVREHITSDDFSKSFYQELASSKTPPRVFSMIPGVESELRQVCAATGGSFWNRLFVPEPLEQLRRWTRPLLETRGSDLAHLRAQSLGVRPAVEVIPALVQSED